MWLALKVVNLPKRTHFSLINHKYMGVKFSLDPLYLSIVVGAQFKEVGV